MSETADIVIVGGGIVGLATALAVQAKDPTARVTVIEKEPEVAAHQSGRNSGVIHAGVYYKPGSRKARFCRAGVAATHAFCDEYGVPYQTCGKLIVAKDTGELGRMRDLLGRARENGIKIDEVDETGLRELEPHIRGAGGLLSPTTGIVDWGAFTRRMAEVFTDRGGRLRLGLSVTGGHVAGQGLRLTTDAGPVDCGKAVVCAGLHADRMVTAFGGRPDFRLIPFRGEYFRINNQPDDLVSHLIYPVPNPARPFLGVHLTRKMDGGFTVGPNAVLAGKREGYSRSALSVRDLAATAAWPGFWAMLWSNLAPAMGELADSVSKRRYLKQVHAYCDRIQLADLERYRPGVRAQAVARDGTLIDDFHFVETENCLHVANAPSPAATASIPIGEEIAGRVLAG